jgi:uncharacterized membrane protein YqiK
MDWHMPVYGLATLFMVFALIRFLMWLLGVQILGNTEVGIVEQKIGGKPLVGGIIALEKESGFQPEVLRGGVHFLPGWRFKIHKVGLVNIQRGQIGYVFSRGGKPLTPGQTLANVVCDGDFTDARKFLDSGGQQGPQIAILSPGAYAINLALFTVISGPNSIAYLPLGGQQELQDLKNLATKIEEVKGFSPVIIDGSNDMIGIVTVHAGPTLPSGTLIAGIVGDDKNDIENYHNGFQDPNRFLKAGGFRGRQLQVLTEGTYFINALFATVEPKPKTHIPIGSVGVVVSFSGERGNDTSGDAFRHGELCEKGGMGIWNTPILPGKYAYNPYAMDVVLVPTTNIILKWNASETGDHRLDRSLREIELITKDAFEPLLPLSVVVQIDYRKAPHVIQRFGSVEKLIEQSLDPLVAAYFKDKGQVKTLIELIHARGDIQSESTDDMRTRFMEYDLNLAAVLIGTPHSKPGDDRIEVILDQLRERQVAREQAQTYTDQAAAQQALKELNERTAIAVRQSDLTGSNIAIEVATNNGRAEAARAEEDAKRNITLARAQAMQTTLAAEAEARKTVLAAEAEAQSIELRAKANASATAQVALAEALGVREKRKAYGNAETMVRLQLGQAAAEAIGKLKQPLVPTTVISASGSGEGGSNQNVLESLMTLMLAQKMGLTDDASTEAEELSPELQAFKDSIVNKKKEEATTTA